MAMIIVGVVCVGLKQSNTATQTDSLPLIVAVLFAIGVGLVYTITSLQCRVFIKKSGIQPIQYNIDAMAL